MGRYIVKLVDSDGTPYYLEWSTIVDAPVTRGMSLEQFKKYYLEEYGKCSYKDLDDRLVRVELHGVSAYDLDSLLVYNRAGDKESRLTKEEILEKYCRPKKEVDSSKPILPEDEWGWRAAIETICDWLAEKELKSNAYSETKQAYIDALEDVRRAVRSGVIRHCSEMGDDDE